MDGKGAQTNLSRGIDVGVRVGRIVVTVGAVSIASRTRLCYVEIDWDGRPFTNDVSVCRVHESEGIIRFEAIVEDSEPGFEIIAPEDVLSGFKISEMTLVCSRR